MSRRIASLLACGVALAGLGPAAFAAGPELRVEIHEPAAGSVVPNTETSVEVVGGASIYGGVRYLDLFLVMDTSKSLRRTDPKDNRTAGAVGLIRSLSQKSDIRIGVVDFDGNTELLSPLTDDREAVIAALRDLDQNGTTNIAEGIRTALRGFQLRGRPGASRVILLFTDGKSDEQQARAAMGEALRNGVAVHTLLLGADDEGEAMLREIASGTGGSFVHVIDPAKLPQAFLNLRTTGVESVVLRADGSAPIPAVLAAGTFSARVPVRPGPNRIVATAVSLTGAVQQAEVTVVVSGPLRVAIESPADGAVVGSQEGDVLVEGVASLFADPTRAGPGDLGLGMRDVTLRVNDSPPIAAALADGRFQARVPLADGENRIVATATSADGRSMEDAVTVSVRATGCAELRVEAVRGDKPTLSISERATLLVFDASNSMWGRMDGQPKISVAKKILGDVLDWVPDDLVLGLRVYGNRHAHKARNCTDTELLVPLASGSRDHIRQAVAGFKPRGQTPLGYSLEQVAHDFGDFRGERAVVLVTDGIESCGGDPAAAARALQSGGHVPVHVIGFGLGSAEDADRASLQAIAAASGGKFLTARSADELRDALQDTVGTPFQVKRGQETVAHGALGSDALLLPEGEYTVRLDSAPPYEVPVVLSAEQGTTLTLKRQGRKVMLARSKQPIAYKACEDAEPSMVWEEIPDRGAPPAAAPDSNRLR